jgi:hypothetical protein
VSPIVVSRAALRIRRSHSNIAEIVFAHYAKSYHLDWSSLVVSTLLVFVADVDESASVNDNILGLWRDRSFTIAVGDQPLQRFDIGDDKIGAAPLDQTETGKLGEFACDRFAMSAEPTRKLRMCEHRRDCYGPCALVALAGEAQQFGVNAIAHGKRTEFEHPIGERSHVARKAP